eukprot:94550-Amphidinium_carterae.1
MALQAPTHMKLLCPLSARSRNAHSPMHGPNYKKVGYTPRVQICNHRVQSLWRSTWDLQHRAQHATPAQVTQRRSQQEPSTSTQFEGCNLVSRWYSMVLFLPARPAVLCAVLAAEKLWSMERSMRRMGGCAAAMPRCVHGTIDSANILCDRSCKPTHGANFGTL